MWPPGHERFDSRTEAGRALGDAVGMHLNMLAPILPEATRPLVLALPRGGAPVGFEVAKALGAEFDLVMVHKIGLPWQPEFGVGAVAEDGPPVFDHGALDCAGISVADMGPAVARERLQLGKHRERLRPGRSLPDVTGRVVIIVDDGLATGITARAAIRALRPANPAHLAFAAPVTEAECHDWLADEVDAVIDLHSPREFFALGMYYRKFPMLTDKDVERIVAIAGVGV